MLSSNRYLGRARIWQKARELYLVDMLRSDPLNPPPLIMPEDKELREAGYFDRAKILVLRVLRASTDPADQELMEKGRRARKPKPKARRRRR